MAALAFHGYGEASCMSGPGFGAYSALRWNDGFRANSGRSWADPCWPTLHQTRNSNCGTTHNLKILDRTSITCSTFVLKRQRTLVRPVAPANLGMVRSPEARRARAEGRPSARDSGRTIWFAVEKETK